VTATDGSAETLVETARAKINLALHVTGRQSDGYHALDSLVCFAEFGDRLDLRPGESFGLTVDGPMAPHLAGADPADNLVSRAVALLARQLGRPADFAIGLTKRLPVASGIGGGSADAAAALRLACRHWQVSPDLAPIARDLGADVPMCLASRPARARGRGELLTPMPGRLRFGLLLVNPGVPVSTPEVFRHLTRRDNAALPDPPPMATPAEFCDWLAGASRNDLQPAALALAPAIGTVLAALAGLPGVRFVRMSGSGATCFGLFDSQSDADLAGAVLRQQAGEAAGSWWICATESRL